MKNTRLLNFALAAAVGLATGAPLEVHADDTEIYTGGNLVEGVRPNVLIILDTSGSMSTVDSPAVDPRDRLEIMQSAIRRIVDEVDNINVGLMRFTDGGGPVLFPTRAIDGDATAIVSAGQSDISVRITDDADDAEELQVITTLGTTPAVTGDVILDNAYLELMDTRAFGQELSILRRVSAGDRDAEQSETFYNNNSATLEMVFNAPGNGTRTIGLNFEQIENVNRDTDGAAVVFSRLTVTPQQTQGGPLSAKVFGLFAGDMGPFPASGGNQAGACPGGSADDIYCRLGLDQFSEYASNPINFANVETYSHTGGTGNVTDAVVLWDPVIDSIANEPLLTPDLTPVLQEIFDHPNWQQSDTADDLGLFITGTTGSFRPLDSFDNSPLEAALLQVDYVAKGAPAGRQIVAFRFRDVKVPRGTDIQKATLELTPVNNSNAPMAIRIRAERVNATNPSAPPFSAFSAGTGTGQRLSGRLASFGTTSQVVWSLPSTEEWVEFSPVQTPDISQVLEEVVADGSWCGGNDLVVFLEYDTVPGTPQTRRVYAHDGDPSFAARLNVDFDEQQFGPGQGCTVDEVVRQVGGERDDAEEDLTNDQVFLDSSTMEMAETDRGFADGIIFRGLQIPQNSVIESAVVEFTARGRQAPLAGTISVRGILDNVLPPFSTTPGNITSRTTARGTVNSTTFPVPTARLRGNETVTTSDLAPILQEVVQLANWDIGDDFGLVFTGTGQVNLHTFDGDPSRAARLRARVRYNIGDVVAAGVTPTIVTVRERIKEIVDGLTHAGNTPIVDTLFEGVSYFRGDPVVFGRNRTTPLNFSTVQRNTRLSHPSSYTGGVVFYPPGCNTDDSNLGADACRTQSILSNPVYTSPIQESCQTNFIILLTDGAATSNSSQSLVQTLTGAGSCQTTLTGGETIASGTPFEDALCGIDLVRFAFDNDMARDVPGSQNISTYTIAFVPPDFRARTDLTEDQKRQIIDLPYLENLAAAGDGQFVEAGDEETLVDAFKQLFADVLSRTTSFAAPSLSVNAFNRLEDRNEVYFSLFEPSDKGAWPGNIKKYQLCQSSQEACFNPPDIEIGDVLDASATPRKAVGDNGRILDDALSFWFTTPDPDGPATELGGAANRVPGHASRRVLTLTDEGLAAGAPTGTQAFSPLLPQPAGIRPGQPLTLDRNRFVDVIDRIGISPAFAGGGDGIIDDLPGTLDEQEIQTETLLGVVSPDAATRTSRITREARHNLINWIRGKDVDNRFDDALFGEERFAFGDPLHGNPLAITYGGTPDAPIIKLVAATNDGGIRLINTENGIEEFIFIPPSLLDEQQEMRVNATGDRIYGVDGSATPWIRDVGPSAQEPDARLGVIEPDRGDFVRIVIGQRRGGNNYWALDISPTVEIPDADTEVTTHVAPSLIWRIRGGTPEYPMLGQTWSKPVLASVLVGTGVGVAAERRDVFIFAGGYDPDTQDAGYAPGVNVGNAIYVADALTGQRLFYAGGPAVGAIPGANALHATGSGGVEVPDMVFPIPSDVAAFDADGDGSVDRLYVGDAGGQMWRVDLRPNRVNGQGGLNGVVGKLAVVSSDAAPADERKFFFPPSVIQVRGPGSRSNTDYDLVSAVTGNRANPLNNLVRDRFYAFRDKVIGPLADTNNDGLADSAAYPTIQADLDGAPGASPPVAAQTFGDMVDLTEFNGPDDPTFPDTSTFTNSNGFYIRLDTENPGEGEKGLAAPTTIAGRIFFTTFLPQGVVDEDRCTLAEGRGLLYGLDAITGAAIFNWDESGDGQVTRSDRVYTLGSGIPSSPVPVFFPEKVMLLVGIGGGAETVDPEIVVPRQRTYWFQQDVQ